MDGQRNKKYPHDAAAPRLIHPLDTLRSSLLQAMRRTRIVSRASPSPDASRAGCRSFLIRRWYSFSSIPNSSGKFDAIDGSDPRQVKLPAMERIFAKAAVFFDFSNLKSAGVQILAHKVATRSLPLANVFRRIRMPAQGGWHSACGLAQFS